MSNFLIAFVKCRASCCEEHFFRQIVFEEEMRIKEYCAWQVKFQESLVISAAVKEGFQLTAATAFIHCKKTMCLNEFMSSKKHEFMIRDSS